MISLVLGIHMLLCCSLVGLVLLQQGKGAGMGAAFGGANSQTVFGAAGAGNVLTKITTSIAICFMITSIILVRHYGRVVETQGVVAVDPLEGSVMNTVVDTVADTAQSTAKSATKEAAKLAATENSATNNSQSPAAPQQAQSTTGGGE